MHLSALTSYLQGLRENNNKAWFVMNKPAYDILRPEFIALVSEVITTLAKTDPKIALVNPKKALFRIYRDIRFSNDKTPYKTYFSASIAEDGVKNTGPMYYLSINADGVLHLGAGCWSPPTDVLKRIRTRIVEDHARFGRIVRGKRLVEAFGGLSRSDTLSRLPKGFDPEATGVDRYGDWVRLKSFVVSADVDLTKKTNAKFVASLGPSIAATFAAATPLDDWLRAAVVAPATT